MTRDVIGALALLLIVFIGLFWVDRWRSNGLRERVAASRQEAALATETGKITERTLSRETIIYKQAEEAARAVESAEGAEAPIPPDVRSSWCAGLGMPDSCAPDDKRPREP